MPKTSETANNNISIKFMTTLAWKALKNMQFTSQAGRVGEQNIISLKDWRQRQHLLE